MKIKYSYSGKEFRLEPYNTSVEKEMLLAVHLGCDTYADFLEILGVQKEVIQSLTEDEQIAMLYKFRTVSVGDELPLKYKCNHCSQANEIKLSVEPLVTDSNIQNKNIKDAYKTVSDDNIQDFLVLDVNELDVDEYDTIFNEIKEQVTKFNFSKQVSCMKCFKPNIINIKKKVIEHMSEDSLISLYQTYNDLAFHGKYSKQDIDTMYPFERSILIGLLNKTREDLAKK